MRRLHCERHTDAERSQRHHRRCAHADENHLPKDLGDTEKLAGKRRNEHPVKQAEIELKIVFQSADAQDAKLRSMTKAENSSGPVYIDEVSRIGRVLLIVTYVHVNGGICRILMKMALSLDSIRHNSAVMKNDR